jgi:hypothetical protein
MWKKFKKMGATDEEIQSALDDYFVDYSAPLNKYTQYLDTVGIFMFSKYYFRIFQGIRRLAYTKLFSMLGIGALELATNIDVQTISDTPANFDLKLDFFPIDELYPVLIPDIIRIPSELL